MTVTYSYADETVNTSQLVESNEWQLGVTLGYGQLEQPVAHSDNIELFIIPDIRYYGENFSVENLDVSYALVQQPNIVVELVSKQNFDGIYFSGDHRDAFASFAASGTFIRQPGSTKKQEQDPAAEENILPQHKSLSYMAGTEFRRYGKINYFLTTLVDVSNVHNGYELNFNLHYQYKFEKINGNFEVGIIHKSDKMSNYYYGVDYAQFEKNNYKLGSSNNYYLQYTTAYSLSEHWYALAVVKQQWLDSNIGRSPIITRSNILSYFVGIKYIY